MSFEGSIGEIDLVQRLVELGREHFTGAIRFEQDGIIKIVYFKDGDVLSASTNDRKDAIDEILLRAGKVSREHIKQALAKRQESETLGDALLNLGFITRKELTWARRIQVIGILRSVRSWTNGTYAIVADYLPKREEGTLFPLPQIIVEFIVTEQDRQTFDRAMDGGEAVFHKAPAFDSSFPALDLNEDAAEIVNQIDGSRSAAEIAGVTGKDAFNVYKLLEALRILGLIEKAGAAAAPSIADDFGFETAGVADAADAWNATPEPQPEMLSGGQPPSAVPDSGGPLSFAEAAAPAAAMPVWETPAEPPMSFDTGGTKVPFALTLDDTSALPPAPPAPSVEQQWGFDEAQIEASQRATSPAPAARPIPPRRPALSQPMRKQKRSGGRAFGIIISLLLAGIITAGWWWWHTQNATPAPAPVAARPLKHPLIKTPPPMTAPPEVTNTTTAANASVPQVATPVAPATQTTASAAPPPALQPAPQPATPEPPKVASRLEQTSTGRVITNTPAESGPPDANRDHYEAMAEQFAQHPAGNYTVQFELVCQTSSLVKAIAAGGANVWFVPVAYHNHKCFRVFWGHFDTRDQAVAALERIPPDLKASTPVVVSVPRG